jgi:hypothetical protein
MLFSLTSYCFIHLGSGIDWLHMQNNRNRWKLSNVGITEHGGGKSFRTFSEHLPDCTVSRTRQNYSYIHALYEEAVLRNVSYFVLKMEASGCS